MSISAPVIFDTVDPSILFSTLNALIAQLNAAVRPVVLPDFAVYVKGSSVPGVDDQDKAWIRTGVDGTPFGTYVFKSGFWIREAPLLGARIGIYAGNPALDFDGTGKGLKGAGPIAGDAYGWALMNGANTTADVSDKFIIAAHMSDLSVGYSSGWRTNVEGSALATGGAATITLDASTTYNAAAGALSVGKWKADSGQSRGGTSDDTFPLYGLSDADPTKNVDLIAADAGSPTPDPISIVNPYFALAYCQFIGYTY